MLSVIAYLLCYVVFLVWLFYSGCASEANESGGEFLYRLELDETTAIRAVVLDRGEVDIDIHLLDASGEAEGCLARDNRSIQGILEAGIYYFSLDTFVKSDGEEMAGRYLFALLACESEDAACMNPIE